MPAHTTRRTLTYAAAGAVLATGLITIPAQASTVSGGPAAAATPTFSSELTDRQQKRFGKRYLSIVCPVVKGNDEYARVVKASFPNPRFVRYGTPLTSAYRRASAKMARLLSREAVRLNKTEWPDEIAWMAEEMERGAYKNTLVYQRRAKSTVFHASIASRKFYSTGNTSTKIRRALELPPAGMGC